MKSVDYKLFFTVLILIIFWMIMISSVSVWWSFRVTSTQAAAWYIESAYNHFYVIRNIVHVLISMMLVWVLVKVKYTYYEKYSKQIFGLAIILLIVVLILWEAYKWARWWISIPGIPFNIQPTEFLKFALIVYLASFFKQYKQYLHTFNDGFVPFAIVLWVVLLLVWAQPDFGTILVVVPISFMMFFFAWANVKYLSLSHRTSSHCYRKLMIHVTMIWPVCTEILISSRSTMRFYFLSCCRRTRISMSIYAYEYVYVYMI